MGCDRVHSVPSFLDLRSFADRAVASRTDAGAIGRWPLPLPPGPVTVGALLLPAGRHTTPAKAEDEFLVLHAGSASVEVEGVGHALSAGDALVLSAGTRAHWQCAGDAVFLSMAYAKGTAGGGIVRIDPDAPLEPSGTPSTDLLTTPVPSCRNHTDYRSGDGEFVCGTWDSTPYARKAMRYRHYELMHLLEGEVEFVDAAGVRARFSRGDIFLVRQGAECSWDSRVHVRKVYAIWRPA